MTTNDKPVCYQYQPKGAKDWFSFNTAKERDEQMALVTGYYNGEMVARDLYARPQPAAPQVPEGWVLAPREPTREMLDAVSGWEETVLVAEDDHREYPVSSETFADAYRAMIALANLATPPAPEQLGSDIARRVMRADEIQRRTGCSIATAVELARAGERQPAPEQPKPAGDDVGLLSLAVGYCIVDGLPRAPEISEAFDRIKARLSAKPAGDVEAVPKFAKRIAELVFDDGYAAGFQTMGRYRDALIREVVRLAAQPAQADPDEAAKALFAADQKKAGPFSFAFEWDDMSPLMKDAYRELAQPAQGEGEK